MVDQVPIDPLASQEAPTMAPTPAPTPVPGTPRRRGHTAFSFWGFLTNFVNGAWSVILAGVNPIFDIIDTRKIIRRGVFLGIIGITLYFPFWAMKFAETTQRSGSDISLIIGTIWAPLNVLVGFIFHKYDASSPNNSPNGQPPIQ